MGIKMSCPPDRIVTDYQNGVIVCTENGVVIDIVYDYSPPNPRMEDWYSKISFSPINPVQHDYGLHTEIGLLNGGGLTAEQARLRKLNKLIRYAESSKRYVSVVKNAREILLRLGIPSLLPEVAQLARQIKCRPRCRTNRALAAALVYIVCRTRGIPRTLQDVADVASLRTDEVGRCYRWLVERFNMKPQHQSPALLVPRVSSLLRLPGEVSALAVSLLNMVQEKCGGFQGNDPLGVAAGAVYVAALMSNMHVPQTVIAKKVGISEVTIRARYRDIATCLERNGLHVPRP